MSDVRVRIKTHAWERYCQRVSPISKRGLYERVKDDLREGYDAREGYLHTGGIWWRGQVTRQGIELHTCYGWQIVDVPEAIRWAKRHRDRLLLD